MGRALVTLIVLAAASAAAAVQMTLDPRTVSQAVAIGQSRVDADRGRFHRPYRIDVARPPVDYVEIVTPFRRVVLAAQARAQVGDRTFGQREGLAMAAETGARLDAWIEMTFHPLNTFVGVPAYEVRLEPARGEAIAPVGVEPVPRYGARVEGLPLPGPVPGGLVLPETSQPMLGGTLIASFDGERLDPNGVYALVMRDGDDEIMRVRVNLAGLR